MRTFARSTVFRSAILVAVLALAQGLQIAAAAEKVFDKKFAATPGGTLTVDSNVGSIIISGTDGREVVVHATMTGQQSQIDAFELTAETDGKGVLVRGKRQGDWWLNLSWMVGRDLRVKFEIQVPKEYHLEVDTSGGNIEAQDIKGNVRARTSGGQLRFTNIAGSLDGRSSGGSISGQQIAGNAELRTSGGAITITDATGDLLARTSGGSIRLQNIDGKVTARTSGGSIETSLKGANRGVDLHTSGGGIRVAVPPDFKASVDAHASGGGVRCDLPIRSTDDDDEHNSLKGDLNGGGPTLMARTSGGSIRIHSIEQAAATR